MNTRPTLLKTFFAAILLFCTIGIARAQDDTNLPVDPATNKVSYSAVTDAPGASGKAILERARKWILTQNSAINPYTITYDDQESSVSGKGTFTLSSKHFKYVIQFNIKVMTKDGKCKYDFTDLIVQYYVPAKSSSGGWGYYHSSTMKDAETLEYSLETFYPSHLTSHKPKIKWYEEINEESLATLNKQMQSIANSFREAVSTKANW